jgi:hypothetical protein
VRESLPRPVQDARRRRDQAWRRRSFQQMLRDWVHCPALSLRSRRELDSSTRLDLLLAMWSEPFFACPTQSCFGFLLMSALRFLWWQLVHQFGPFVLDHRPHFVGDVIDALELKQFPCATALSRPAS